MQNGSFDVGVDFHPAGRGENTLHSVLGADDQEIDHVSGITFFVGNAARDFREQMVVNAGKRTDLLGGHARGTTFGDIHLDAHDVVAVSGVVGGLIDANRKPARDGRNYIATTANDEGSSDVFIADEPDECTASGFVVRQNAEKVLEAARQAVWSVVVFSVNVMELAGGGHEHVFASLNVDASIDPGFLAGQLDFLGKALFALRGLRRRSILRALLARNLLGWRHGILADELPMARIW